MRPCAVIGQGKKGGAFKTGEARDICAGRLVAFDLKHILGGAGFGQAMSRLGRQCRASAVTVI